MRADGRKSGLAFTLLIAVQAGIAVVSAQEAADTEVTIAERLERIENALSNQGLLEMVQQVQSLEVEISRLRGQMEEQTHELEQLRKRQRDLYTDIDRRIQHLENPVTAATGALAGEGEPPLQTLSPFQGTEVTGGQQAETPLTMELVEQEPATGAAVAEGGDGFGSVSDTEPVAVPEAADIITEAPVAVDPALIEAAYRHAFELLKQSLYDPAIKAFREFLARYPGSDHADNAQFWLAEAYYVNSRFGQALVEYSTLVQRYPDSPKRAQATLKAAFCQHEMGQVDAARRQLDEIIQQYPGTTAASLAQDRLAEIAAPAMPVDSAPPE